jgi:hypothetical protein
MITPQAIAPPRCKCSSRDAIRLLLIRTVQNLLRTKGSRSKQLSHLRYNHISRDNSFGTGWTHHMLLTLGRNVGDRREAVTNDGKLAT